MEKKQSIDKGLKDLINETATDQKFHIPTQIDNPNGLHQRYSIYKLVNKSFPARYNHLLTLTEAAHERIVEEDVDPKAEYFVMRLDEGGKDRNHIAACRIGVHAYADAIESFIPELAKDLRERYPLL